MAPRISLSCKEKMEIINANESEKFSVRKLAERFKIGKTQAAEILKNKEAIKTQWQSGSNNNMKRISLTSQGAQVDKLCYEWFVKARAKNIPISGPIVKTKAMEIGHQVGYSGFAASDGWLQKWRKRHNITFKTICGEASVVCPVDVSQFKQKLPSIDSSLTIEDDNIEINITDQSDVDLSDSDDEIIVQPIDSIKSYDEALVQMERFKELASLDLISYQIFNIFKSRIEHLHLKHKQENSKQSK